MQWRWPCPLVCAPGFTKTGDLYCTPGTVTFELQGCVELGTLQEEDVNFEFNLAGLPY